MPINSEPGHIWCVNYGDNGRPAGVGPVIIDNLEELIPSGSGGHTYTGGNGIDVDNVNDTISLDSETEAAINSYVTNSGAFITSADVPVIGFENDGVLDTDYDGIKITNDSVGNEHVNLKKGETWYNHGLLVPTSTGNDKYLTTTSAGHLSWENQPEIPSLDGYATETWVSEQGYLTSIPSEYVTDTEMSTYVAGQTSAFITSADVPEVPGIKDLVAGNGIDITTTSSDVTISVDNSVFNGYATETWTAQNYFPIDGLQVVSSSAEASAANVIYIVSGSNQ